jgi:hypothetical protein
MLKAFGRQGPHVQDCYCYNLWVKEKSSDERRLFPVDPQIDNLAPPGGDGEGYGDES